MLREVAHFLWHAPDTLALKNKLSQEALYDTLMARGEDAGMAAHRAALVADLSGDVLEIGCGTGLMFAHYPAGAAVTAIEPDEAFLQKAEPRAGAAAAPVRLQAASAEDLPFEADAFDAVVVGLVLCSVGDVGRVLGEIRRVLKPGGEVRLIEHVRSAHPVSGALMDVFNPLWLALNGQGCHMNRDTEQTLRREGFDLREVIPFQVFAPGLPAFPMRRIRAATA